MPVSDDKKFQERFVYHRHMVDRRWQYFAAFMLIDSFLFGSLDKLLTVDTQFKSLVAAGALFAACVFMHLIGRARLRLKENGTELNILAAENIVNLGEAGSMNLKGDSIWLWLGMFVLSLPWFYILQNSSILWLTLSFIAFSRNLAGLPILYPDNNNQSHKTAKYFLRAVIWFLLLFLIVFGSNWMDQKLGGIDKQATSAKKVITDIREKVQVGYLPSLAASQLYVAIDQGYFEREGLDVTIREIYSGSDIIQALSSRAIEIGFGVLPSIALARSNGVNVRSLVAATIDSGSIREHRLIVRKESQIKSPNELSGKKIALVAEPTSDGLSLFEFLEEHGIAKSSVQLIKIPHPEMTIALTSGLVDAAAAIEPFISEGEILGKTKELAFYYPNKEVEVGTFVVTDDWQHTRPIVAAKFARAIREATRWINQDPKKLRSLLSNLRSKGINFEVSAAAANIVHLPGFRDEPTKEGVTDSIRLLKKYGFLKKPVIVEDILPVSQTNP